MSKTDLIRAYIIISSHIWIWHLDDLINGAHSRSAIRGSFSIDDGNGNGSENHIILKSGFILDLDPKIKSFSRLFSKTTVFFQTQG